MRVVVFVKATVDSEAEIMPGSQLLEEMGRYNEQLVDAGIMLGGDGLKPSKYGKRIVFNGVGRSVVDGPFAETKELVAGYWIWEVRDMNEAVEWVKRCPNPMLGESEIEIRPVFEMADFAEQMTPEADARRRSLCRHCRACPGNPSRGRSLGTAWTTGTSPVVTSTNKWQS
jgi:hypothetical protein